ncbi:MAG: hypothetical protein H6Q86_764, partial [candidate division NC10 bacterium]|nr:hypothetical protein [candidate division NC10 bacterium]
PRRGNAPGGRNARARGVRPLCGRQGAGVRDARGARQEGARPVVRHGAPRRRPHGGVPRPVAGRAQCLARTRDHGGHGPLHPRGEAPRGAPGGGLHLVHQHGAAVLLHEPHGRRDPEHRRDHRHARRRHGLDRPHACGRTGHRRTGLQFGARVHGAGERGHGRRPAPGEAGSAPARWGLPGPGHQRPGLPTGAAGILPAARVGRDGHAHRGETHA